MDNNIKFSKVSVFIELETELFEKTEIFYKYLTEIPYSKNSLYELELAKIHSMYVALKTFTLCNEELMHHEIYSLLECWNNTFLEMQSVVSDGDRRNTSWLFSQYGKYVYEHGIVDNMYRGYYSDLKTTLDKH